jgi:ATP-dependent DNA helicase DinG
MANLHDLFGPGGALARTYAGFVPRVGQRRMAERIASALDARELLLVEAGTGTGKTFAYLVPALLSGRRVLISTGTRTLQDQLYARDLPLLGAALGRPVQVALLKGRANYLCRARLPGIGAQQSLLPQRERGAMARFLEWAGSTQSGDLAEVPTLGEADPLRTQFTSTRESCTGNRCAEFARCHVVAARRAALEADIVVVNHHLLLADLALKEDGFGELLPGVDALILDEAHQLPDLAAEFFGVSCGSRQIELLLADVRRELARLKGGAKVTNELMIAVDQPLRAFAASLGSSERRVAWQDLAEGARANCDALRAALLQFAGQLEALDGGVDLQQCAVRARHIADALAQIGGGEAEQGARAAVVSARGFQLSLLPYDISARFRGLVKQRPSAWIFTSATLALSGNFSHFAGRLGLDDAETLCVDSPFDYERQALLYLPTAMPDPAATGYTGAVLEVARPLIAAAGGGAFLLFTSHRALNAAARALRADERPMAGPLLVQGEAPRELLLRQFRDSGRALLLGTASFWEGVDVQGAALRLVVIDKLPFAHIDDPLVRARVEYLQSQGGNPFRDYQLPEAALALKQGVGRLIRSEEDRGVVVICDPRLTTRGYGKSLLAALPPMRVTRNLDEALALLRRCELDLGSELRGRVQGLSA